MLLKGFERVLFTMEELRVFYNVGNNCFTQCLDKTPVLKYHSLQCNVYRDEER
jgi:hypothetical protein